MCDIYGEPCKICGNMWEMHLGDYETSQYEIFLICSKCYNTRYEEMFKKKYINFTIWKRYRKRKYNKYIIVSLTENAWAHRGWNHLNESRTDMIKENDKDVSIKDWKRIYEEHHKFHNYLTCDELKKVSEPENNCRY